MLQDTFDEVINGKRYVIKPGETINLPRSEAVEVKGHYLGQKRVCLKIVHLPEEEKRPDATTSRIYVAPDGTEFTDKVKLQEYMKKRA
jgi:hypothetical protein